MSVNISKRKREDLIRKISEIKKYLSRNSNNPEFIRYMSELENELKGIKYGLVFEEHRENIDDIMDTNTVVFEEQTDLFIDKGGTLNFLIEGDNLPALKLLQKTHKGKIDVIYIDPPYNRGSNDFIYDDKYIGKEDTYRHSKWLSFMIKRLSIAKYLLSNIGVIFISIDDNEQANLKILCDDIFGEHNLISQIIITSNSAKNNANFISVTHEYMVCYAKNINKLNQKWQVKKNNILEFNKRSNSLLSKELDQEEIHKELLELVKYPRFYDFDHYTYVDNKGPFRASDLTAPNSKSYFDILHPITKKPCKIGIRGWAFSIDGILKLIKEDRILFGEDENTIPQLKNHLCDNETQLPRSILFFDSQSSTKWLKANNLEFEFPKAVDLIKYVISMYPKKNQYILDFFAGSGTTGHAVMELNKEDEGSRRFILVTNNENNICRDVTYERIKRVIDKENYKASLKYFKVGFVNTEEKLYYEYADSLLLHIKELVELENGVNFYKNNKVDILLTDEEVTQFINNIKEHKKCKKLYLGHDILLTNEQEEILKTNNIKWVIIPDYYYSELRG